MSDEPALLYLEPDDEITSLVRRLRSTEEGRVVVVAPGRAKATSSATAMRLLARVASEIAREVAVVGDALTRSLAAEAGLTAFASVDDARAARPSAPVEPQRAAITVLREDATPAGVDDLTATHRAETIASPHRPREPVPVDREPGGPLPPTGHADDTRAHALPPPPRARPRPRPAPTRRRDGRSPRSRWAAAGLAIVLLAFVAVGAALATVAPAATITIQAATEQVGPFRYELTFDGAVEAGTAEASVRGTATGTYTDRVAASGVVTLFNWSFGAVEVPAGTGLATTGGVAFATTEPVVVPAGRLISFVPLTIEAGQADVGAAAVEAGEAGNVAAGAIAVVTDEAVAAGLRGLSDNPEGLVVNEQPTAGGIDESGPRVTRADVDDAVAMLRSRLREVRDEALGDAGDAVVAEPPGEPEPLIEVPDDLVGRRDTERFTIEGSLEYARAAVPSARVDAGARDALAADGTALPNGWRLVPDTIRDTVVEARIDGEALVVEVEVGAVATPVIDADALRADLLGRPVAEAEAMLESLGAVTVATWPSWVDSVPRVDWRVEIDVIEPTPQSASPEPTIDAEPSPS